MTKPTYREQLLDPRWQRRRLECLEAAEWACETCAEESKTLHVHHRQYFKGRLAWEYSNAELVVLCDPCHSSEHSHLEVVQHILSLSYAGDAAALLAGFHAADDYFDRGTIEMGKQTNHLAFAAGYVAWLTYNLDIDDMRKVAALAASLANANAESRLHFECSRGDTFGGADK